MPKVSGKVSPIVSLNESPGWKYEDERGRGESHWHEEKIKIAHFRYKSAFVADSTINIYDIGMPSFSNKKSNKSFQYTPLYILKRRHVMNPIAQSSRPISIITGGHGRWNGQNWKNGENTNVCLTTVDECRRAFLSGRFCSKTDQYGYVYFCSEDVRKYSFESRIRIYDITTLKVDGFDKLISDPNCHVILDICYGRNDVEFRRVFDSDKILPPVVSYITDRRPSFFEKKNPFFAPVGSRVTDKNGNKFDVSNCEIRYCNSRYSIIYPSDKIHHTNEYGLDSKIWIAPN